MTYDAKGNLLTRCRPGAQTVAYAYDLRNSKTSTTCLDRLDTAIAAAFTNAQDLCGDVESWHRWHTGHPEATHRLTRLDRDISRLDHQLTLRADLEAAIGWNLTHRPDHPPAPQPHQPGHSHGHGL